MNMNPPPEQIGTKGKHVFCPPPMFGGFIWFYSSVCIAGFVVCSSFYFTELDISYGEPAICFNGRKSEQAQVYFELSSLSYKNGLQLYCNFQAYAYPCEDTSAEIVSGCQSMASYTNPIPTEWSVDFRCSNGPLTCTNSERLRATEQCKKKLGVGPYLCYYVPGKPKLGIRTERYFPALWLVLVIIIALIFWSGLGSQAVMFIRHSRVPKQMAFFGVLGLLVVALVLLVCFLVNQSKDGSFDGSSDGGCAPFCWSYYLGFIFLGAAMLFICLGFAGLQRSRQRSLRAAGNNVEMSPC